MNGAFPPAADMELGQPRTLYMLAMQRQSPKCGWNVTFSGLGYPLPTVQFWITKQKGVGPWRKSRFLSVNCGGTAWCGTWTVYSDAGGDLSTEVFRFPRDTDYDTILNACFAVLTPQL